MRGYSKGKRDANERPIIDALEEKGCEVQQVSAAGFCDLVVFHRASGLLRLIEVKDRRGKLTDAQREKQPKWPVWLCRTVDQALEAMGLKR